MVLVSCITYTSRRDSDSGEFSFVQCVCCYDSIECIHFTFELVRVFVAVCRVPCVSAQFSHHSHCIVCRMCVSFTLPSRSINDSDTRVSMCVLVLSNKMNVWFVSIYDSMPGSNLVVAQSNSSHHIAIQHMCVYALKISFERQAVFNIYFLFLLELFFLWFFCCLIMNSFLWQNKPSFNENQIFPSSSLSYISVVSKHMRYDEIFIK